MIISSLFPQCTLVPVRIQQVTLVDPIHSRGYT